MALCWLRDLRKLEYKLKLKYKNNNNCYISSYKYSVNNWIRLNVQISKMQPKLNSKIHFHTLKLKFKKKIYIKE